MEIEFHAPSQLVAIVSLALAVLALVCYFVAPPGNVSIAFWLAILAYVVGGFGALVKTS